MPNIVKSNPMSPSTIDEMLRLGEIFRRSGYFKNLTDEAQAVTKILYGQELGFSPVVSMMGIYIVDGKPALSGNLLGALVKRGGKYDFVVKAMTGDECSIEFSQLFSDGKWKSIGVSTFTMKDAEAAGLKGKDTWKRYPKAMLYNRSLSAGVRAFCPDVAVSPVYVPEELGAEVNEDGDVISIPETPSTTVTDAIVLEPVKPEEPVFISTQQQSYLAKRFRESLPEHAVPDAEEYRHKALTALQFSGLFKSKFVDEDGNPTSKLILTQEYDAVGKALVKMAKAS